MLCRVKSVTAVWIASMQQEHQPLYFGAYKTIVTLLMERLVLVCNKNGRTAALTWICTCQLGTQA